VGGDGTVKDSEMPFVNRVEELWRLFEVNARNMHTLRSLSAAPDNFRLFNLLYCIQYFGAGKTTLGKQFGPQLALQVLEARGKGKLESDYQALCKSGIDHVHVDVCSEPNMVLKVVRMVVGKTATCRGEEDAAEQVVAAVALHNKPILIHLDEVGSHKDHDLKSLQLFARAVFAELWWVGHEDFSRMPIIYFLVTGKSTDFFFDLGTSGQSPVASELLVLDMLSPKHIGEVRKNLQQLPQPIILSGLTTDVLEARLDQRLCAATGGAPRLLLYTLRALHYLCKYKDLKLDSVEAINAAIDEQVYRILDCVPIVRSEFVPSSGDDIAKSAYGILLACVLYRKHLRYETELAVGNQEHLVGRLLKSQAFFLSRDHQNLALGEFVLTFPEYHLRAMQSKYHTGVPMLLSCFAGAALPLSEPWRLFEILPAHAMAVSAALRRDINGKPWSEVVPAFFANSAIAKHVLFDLGSEVFSIHQEKDLPAVLQDDTRLSKYCCRAVAGADKSKSFDMVHVQWYQENSTTQVVAVIGWQSKLWFKEPFQMADLFGELAKERGKGYVVMTILSTTFGPHLLGVIDAAPNRVLVLTSWSSDEGAEFVLHTNGTLYWRAEASKSGWCKWPNVSPTTAQPSRSAKVVTVRPKLEAVLPHPAVMKAVLGPHLVDGVIAAHQQNSEPSAMISDLDNILAGKGIQVSTLDKYGALDDKMSMAEVMGMIAEEQRFTEAERDEDLAALAKQRIRTVGNLRVLSADDIGSLALSPVVRNYLLRIAGKAK
jgi:hypothetical protein